MLRYQFTLDSNTGKRCFLKIIYLLVGSIIFVACQFQIQPVCVSHQDEKDIASRYSQFYKSISQKDYETAYSFMTPNYRQTHALDEFTRAFGLSDVEDLPELHPEHSISSSGCNAYVYPRNANVSGLLAGSEYGLIKIEGLWYFTGEIRHYYD